ncbi:TM0106 family RecB-like putative nuclease [Mucilaginibacter sp. BJC16-A38]|uniref:TM0106 family RecB-like putative nuclease n=1 Tax=Mucilaginibacter phenanthrenivorans TaxID=1234842 RepID=UPI002157AA5A|nr:TM0106 family RecB-like putative nuclease [Mucilaginibacter phenanthrenivorans]MCR8560401.1 TM0106 family RecB-like putative nuclease [Mucilaginibacter phenanthrenivorans]
MKLVNDDITFSASDVSNHLACKYLTVLNAKAARGLIDQQQYRDPSLQILQERGQEFEHSYIEALRIKGIPITNPQQGTEGTALSRTIQAMKNGAPAIYQAELRSGKWGGRADFLIKVPRPSQLGDYSYEVLDTKLARETRAGTMLQLALYTQLIAEIQGTMPELMHVATPATSTDPQHYRCDDFMAYFRLVCERMSETVADAEISAFYPDPVSHCDVCSWWRECNNRRRADDHLSLVAGVSMLHTAEIKHWGVDTLETLAQLSLPLQNRPTRGAIDTYVKLREQARVQLTARQTKAPYFETLAISADAGFCKLPAPDVGDIFFDLEGDPFVGLAGLEYLFGWVTDDIYHSSWSFDAEQEKVSFERFVDSVMQRWREHPDMHVYHYTAYEPGALKRLMGKYLTRETEMDQLLRAGVFVDLYTITKQSLRAGIERYSLKELEIFYGFIRKVELRDAAEALRTAERILERTAQDSLPDELKSVIGYYNADDCFATAHLRNWLEKLRKQLIDEGQVIPRPLPASGTASEALTVHDLMVKAIFDQLMAGVPLEKEARSAAQQARWILGGMLDYYRREDKSKWWEYYRLVEMPEDELLEEKAAIAYLQLIPGSRRPEKKSFVDQYRFPFQECELRAGAELKLQNQQKWGTIFAIDKEQGIVSILKGPSIKDIHSSAVFSIDILNASEKQKAIIRLSQWILLYGIEATFPEYRAARDLLLREAPRVRAGIDWGKEPFAAALGGIHMLKGGVLPIQGPPGAGKSYTASNMIIEAVKAGKKVGITAMSHKVIRNLLEKTVEAAQKEGVSLTCLHKVTTLGEPTAGIIETTKNDEVWNALSQNRVQVAGGTAWLWANESSYELVDILFVDEAGQLSLIDTVAAAQGSDNLVLLGDPQQLKQPQQGSHPEGSEVSSLEHILQEHQTITADRGIFLEQTWRMHPNVCSFISELFYENRLISAGGLEKQVLMGPIINGAGLWFLPVPHEGNQSASRQEAEAVKKLVSLLTNGQTNWTDRDEKTKTVDTGDIKIISPYNSQVQEINAILNGTVETGTVDKFQGQESPIIIFSMATSSPENAPRGMDFLYSLNRLNVAVSRAKTACIIVASPKLFEPDCKSPAQIRLANAYCRYLEMAQIITIN